MTRACEEAVRTLSASAQGNVYVEAAHEGADMNVKISRTRFEDLCFDLFKAARDVITKALEDAGTTVEAVDMVLLAGGESCSRSFVWCVCLYFASILRAVRRRLVCTPVRIFSVSYFLCLFFLSKNYHARIILRMSCYYHHHRRRCHVSVLINGNDQMW